jgi:heme exporter protein A
MSHSRDFRAGLKASAARWLIGCFFQPFQKIENRQQYGPELLVFSACRRLRTRTSRCNGKQAQPLRRTPRPSGEPRGGRLMQLTARALACVRGGREVFRNVSFSLAAGGALTIAGPNGAGKSSLLRLVAGLLRPAGGQIRLEGGESELTLAEQVHYLGHLDALKPSLSVGENLSFWVGFLGRGDARTALSAVGLDGLSALTASYLSAGQRRRLSLARLIAVPRPIWLLDEPASALDASGQSLLADLMRSHRAGGGLILAAAHGPIGLEGATELRLGANG